MARLSAKAARYGYFRDLNLTVSSMEDLPDPRKVSRSTVSNFMSGKCGTKKKDMFVKRKIHNFLKSKSQNPPTFKEFWGIDKEYFEVV